MIVLDAPAAADLLLATPRARAVADALSGDVELHAPELIQPEVLSVVRRWLAQRWISQEVADRAVADLGDMPGVMHPHAALRQRAWDLRDRFTASDAHYVALAEALDAPLVTTDGRLARAGSGHIHVVDAS